MKDTYKGESPSKKLVRIMFWTAVGKDIGDELFRHKRFLVLASREGGDIAILRSFGVSPKNILAAEIDEEAHRTVSKKFPEVSVFHGDVAKLANKHHRKFNAAFLDFCSPVTDKVIKTTRAVMRSLKDESYLGVCLLGGRESGKYAAAIRAKKRVVEPRFDRILAGEHPVDVVEELDRYYDDELRELSREIVEKAQEMLRADDAPRIERRQLLRITNAVSRLEVLNELLNAQAQTMGLHLCVQLMKVYQSRTLDNRGVPMVVYLAKARRRRPGESKKKFGRRVITEMRRWDAEHMDDTDRSPLEDINEEDLKKMVLKFSDTSGAPASLIADAFNIPKQRVAAWKAHRTMGTYDEGDGL